MLTGEAQLFFVELGKNLFNTTGKEQENSSTWHAIYFKTTYQHVMLYYFYLTWCISAIYFICEKKETNISDLSKIYSFIEDITSLILRPSTLILNISYTQYAINIPYIEVIIITY